MDLDKVTFEIAEIERLRNSEAFLVDLLRQHRCNSDGAMTVAECVDSGRCRCSIGLKIR